MRVTVSVDHSYGSESFGWDVEYSYDHGQFLSVEARRAIEAMAKVMESHLEGVR